MWFTRTTDSFRAWFQVITGTGVLRLNALSSSFTALIINPADTGTATATVTQSLQKPGVYYFDIPSSFLTGSGPGEYGVSVEVDITTAPKVTTAFSDVLSVSYNDFDSIASASLSSSCVLNTSSIETIVSGVWSAATSSYNQFGTMGYFQVYPSVSVSASISASVDVPSIVSGVWGAQTSSFVQPGTMGLALGSISGSLFSIENAQNQTYNTLLQMSSSLSQISSSVSGLASDVSYISSSVGATYATLLQVSSSVNLSYQTLVQLSSSVASISSSINSLLLSSSNLTTSSIAQGVWDELLATHSISGSTGLALRELAVRVHEIYQILGLELGSPMTVTQTLRAVAAVSQSLAGDPTTAVTVTRL